MRDLSLAIQTVLNSYEGVTKDVVEITIKAQPQLDPPLAEQTLYYANGEGVTIDEQLYENKLRAVGTIKFALSSSPDNCDITIENVSRDLGFILTNTTRIFDGASLIVKRAFKIEDGTFEPVTLFVGQIADTKIDQETINFTAVSDMNKRGTSVAGRTVTQRCIWKFNVNGSGVGPNCGWQTTQAGDPLSCDHNLDSVNGCRSHGNVQRYGGVPSFTAITGNGYDPNDGNGWGNGSGGGWCLTPDSLVLCEYKKERFYLEARQIVEGENLVTIDNFGNMLTTKVVEASVGHTTELITITTKNKYSITCSPSHPIITDFLDNKGTASNLLNKGDKVLVYDYANNKNFVDTIKSIEVTQTNSEVIMFKLEAPFHRYLGGNSKNGFVWSHNRKPFGVYPIT